MLFNEIEVKIKYSFKNGWYLEFPTSVTSVPCKKCRTSVNPHDKKSCGLKMTIAGTPDSSDGIYCHPCYFEVFPEDKED